MIDPFGRRVTYLRVSVTDRCDLRCVYCMSEDMTFLPKADLLSLEELAQVCSGFIGLGIEKIRITGGEPLVRKNVMHLMERLGSLLVPAGHSGPGLRELTLTTNATQLDRHASALRACGVRRINVSLDSLNPDRFRTISRWGDLDKVLKGLKAARQAGLQVKINMVALRGVNDDELLPMVAWCGAEGFDLTLIETMPMGEIDIHRADQYLSLAEVRQRIEQRYTLTDIPDLNTGGPARYVRCHETGGRIGFITPMSHNFCESCNRIRLTCTGQLYMCLGQDDHLDLREVVRQNPDAPHAVQDAILGAIARKPKGHDFVIDRSVSAPAVVRHMSVTGG
ncbi:GTP 3',8-cyclase MoaA [Insolitispirillum peregrinum]|uniref:GTP 3',8-cyclase n=1 Tax=Insolitispirillum peregrinum TaxID=80876 RepID=A0A1N7NN28_9PROT|nr:GTP 3',8-cyclase MoaA [Insolitispirillum peregrinum]SIS99746.1 cyclic pyranopterin monophosphate synthase subunit MoaA [Insolitispirillum peregrinum]